MDEKIHESINQIFHKQKKRPDIERIYDFMIKVEVLLDIPLEALEEIIKTLKKEGKIVNKNLNDADSFYIRQKEVSEANLRTPEPKI